MTKYLKKLSIPQIIVMTYIIFISLGTLLLVLPISSASGEWTLFVDALFSSASAVSVTGMTIFPTLTYWNYFGKTVLMFLIEIGGLGFMTIWVFLFHSVVGKTNLKQRMAVSESLSLTPTRNILQHVWYIIRIALIIQLIGTVLLSFPFVGEYGLLEGLYYALFHSVSAFTNGGLDLFTNSLVNFQENSYVLITIMLLIMSGGLGFIVWDDLLQYRHTKKLQIYTKIVLITTSILWVLGMVLFWLAEHNTDTFAHLNFGEKVLNYFFLSVTMRSSGFSNVNISTLSMGSILLTNVLIFIGASSGSTGGGIKISTLAVIAIVIFRSFQGKQPIVFNRKIMSSTVRKAFLIFTVAILLLVVGTFTLSLTETLPEGFGFAHVFTEVASALGAVGVSLGLTPYLSVPGKLTLITLMLIGRVGIMTFLWSVVGEKRESRINHPETNIVIG